MLHDHVAYERWLYCTPHGFCHYKVPLFTTSCRNFFLILFTASRFKISSHSFLLNEWITRNKIISTKINNKIVPSFGQIKIMWKFNVLKIRTLRSKYLNVKWFKVLKLPPHVLDILSKVIIIPLTENKIINFIVDIDVEKIN